MNPFVKRLLGLPIWVRLVSAVWAMFVLAWALAIGWTHVEQGDMATRQAEKFAESVHQMTMASLTGMMITGTVAQRSVFLDQIANARNITELRVLRADSVTRQFGPGSDRPTPPNADEASVLSSGKPLFRRDADARQLVAVLPVIAAHNYLGKDCLTCHALAKVGEVMGVVSMKISLQEVEETANAFTAKLTLLALVLSLPVVAFIYLFVKRVVTRPLAAMTRGLRVIAEGEGDLTRRLPVQQQDEIGQAAAVFNVVMDKFQGLVRHVSEVSVRVLGASHELASHSAAFVEHARRQNARSVEAARTVERIVQHVVVVNDTATMVRERSLSSQSHAHKGRQSMSGLSQAIQSVDAAVGAITHTVDEFVHSTQAITSLTEEVKEIANQTNLLALNAAIEAARAGEQGRGFAVVADEVRKLAEKSGHSAHQISQVAGDIGAQSSAVRTSIETGTRNLDGSLQSMSEVAEVLTATGSVVDEVCLGLSDITAAAREQLEASRSVASKMEEIADSARESDLAAAQTLAETRNLEALATQLQGEISRFRL